MRELPPCREVERPANQEKNRYPKYQKEFQSHQAASQTSSVRAFRLSSSRHQEVLPYPLCPWFDRASARSSTFCTDLTDAPAFRQVRHLFQQLWKSDEERILPSLGRHPLHFIDLWPPMSPSLPRLLRKGQGYSTLSSLIFRHKCRLLSDVLR